jgi:hypothetical protein
MIFPNGKPYIGISSNGAMMALSNPLTKGSMSMSVQDIATTLLSQLSGG